MKKIIITLLIVSIMILVACQTQENNSDDNTNNNDNPETIKSFQECIEAGNPIMESYPRQCKANGEIFTEEIENEKKACTKEYRPVCGLVQVQCIKAPCPPIETTFPNMCEAENAGATNITQGACTEEINPKDACLSFDGNWIEETKECEGISQEQCENLGGTFNSCASACRNNPDAEFCTMQCVLVCDFD